MRKIKSIAITGKGGTGKTMIATLLIKILTQEYGLKVLAIDADSAMSLPYTLGLTVNKTISQLRKEAVSLGALKDELDKQPIGEYMSSILTRGNGYDLLAMGRPEEPGCFCAVNTLLRYGIDSLIGDYDVAIIDGEAGPEQINRRVLQNINLLLIVADMSYRSFQTAKGIQEIAKLREDDISVDQSGIILNRVRTAEERTSMLNDMDVFGFVPEDPELNEYDRLGKSLFDLPDNAASMQAIRQVLKRFF